VAAAAGLLASCGLGAEAARARERALAFFASREEPADPSWAPLFGYLHRRFGLLVRDARGRPLRAAAADPARAEVAAVYRRLSDPRAAVAPERIAALPSAVDRLTAVALHCERIPLPPDFLPALRRANEVGGYALTHAALAGGFALENGCLPPEALREIRRAQAERLAAQAAEREALGATLEAGLDVWIESLAMLHYLGEGGRVRGEWLRALLAAQRPDGGWARSPRANASDPHATALALWVLLETLEPGARPVPFVPPRGEAR
jgi:hypothetical protein